MKLIGAIAIIVVSAQILIPAVSIMAERDRGPETHYLCDTRCVRYIAPGTRNGNNRRQTRTRRVGSR